MHRETEPAPAPKQTEAIASVTIIGFAVLVLLSLSRWNTGLVTNYDLGIFAQSAQDYAAGRLPYSEIRQLPLLGDHFSPILALNGLAWRIWPDPRALIVVQAALIALAALVIGFTARGMVGRWAVWVVALFLLGPGVVAADLFDFHETAYAAPLVAVLCVALMRRTWWACVAASVLLLTVKEDLGLTVMGAAACWLVMSGWREWRRAILLALVGVAGVVIAVLVIAHVNPGGGSDYLGLFGIGEKRHVAGQRSGALLDAHRLIPMVTYTVVTGLIGWRSPLTLVALPTLLWRTVSSNPLYWTPEFHYDLIPAVVGALALVHVLSGRTRTASPTRPAHVGGAALPARHRPPLRVAIAACGFAAVTMSSLHAVHRLPAGLALRENSRVADIRALGHHVPADAPVAALNNIGAYLVATHTDVHQLQIDHPEPVRFVMFTDDDEWAHLYPRDARQALRTPSNAGNPKRVWTLGDVTLVDLGRELSVAKLAR